MRYKVQFTADQAYVDLLEHARDLLQHQIPDRDLARVQQLALEALVQKLSRSKYGATDRARGAPTGAAPARKTPTLPKPAGTHESASAHDSSNATNVPEPRDVPLPCAGPPARSTPHARQPSDVPATPVSVSPSPLTRATAPNTALAIAAGELQAAAPLAEPIESDPPSAPAPTPPKAEASRHLPAALRRAVWTRDGGRCTFVDARGVRCCETARLEFHHEHAHALGGRASLDNIKLRCHAHNDLAAEHDFGRAFMARKKRGKETTAMPLGAYRPRPRTSSSPCA